MLMELSFLLLMSLASMDICLLTLESTNMLSTSLHHIASLYVTLYKIFMKWLSINVIEISSK